VQGRDLGGASIEIYKTVAALQVELKAGNSIEVLGQIQSMYDCFPDLGIGLLFAAVLVSLLMVVNYQNFGDPLVVILALPATFCGIVTILFVAGTSLSVPSLTGAIMAVGRCLGEFQRMAYRGLQRPAHKSNAAMPHYHRATIDPCLGNRSRTSRPTRSRDGEFR
jgi:hypothetical protein